MHPATARAHGDRITPAQAGKRCHLCASTKSSWDHPRVGGEKTACVLIVGLGKGSPPHRRGKVAQRWRVLPEHGITPAWAGKSSAARGCGKAHLDHPRMGGEKADIDDDGLHYKGSPPRGRGKGGDIVGGLGCVRITPAWAGKSLFCFTAAVPIQDHPRIGGEKGLGSQVTQLSQGSPPRRRGKEQGAGGRMAAHGITPAWAGKRQTAAMPRTMTRVHPRMGREKTMYFEDKYFCRGSPPRRRGKATAKIHSACDRRITPAWAGKSDKHQRARSWLGDHPRVGGEKPSAPGSHRWYAGSPPRGRGKGRWASCPFFPPGITPAWAGKRLKRSHRSGIFISGPIPFHSVLHRPAGSGSSRAGRDGSPAGQPQNAGPA